MLFPTEPHLIGAQAKFLDIEPLLISMEDHIYIVNLNYSLQSSLRLPWEAL